MTRNIQNPTRFLIGWIPIRERRRGSASTPDNWTSQFQTGQVEASSLRLFNAVDGDAILKAEAPHIQLLTPSIEILEDSTTGGERKLRLHLVSPRQARIIWLQLEKATVLAATLEGRKVQVNEVDKRNKVWGIVYVVLPVGGIELDLTLNASESPQLTVIDQSDGLPSLPGFHVESRPNDRMSLPVIWPFFDSTVLVSRHVSKPIGDKPCESILTIIVGFPKPCVQKTYRKSSAKSRVVLTDPNGGSCSNLSVQPSIPRSGRTRHFDSNCNAITPG
jgi:hypothetical protein